MGCAATMPVTQLPHGCRGVPGEYGRMVADSNQLVASSNAVTQRLVEVMQRYAVGDLSVDMEALPGEKAVFTAAMATTNATWPRSTADDPAACRCGRRR